jgi:hypothetical protein
VTLPALSPHADISAAQFFGGVFASTMTIEEVLP